MAVTLPQGTATEVEPAAQTSYGQILKSSALIGGSSMLTVVVSVIRVKAMALLLGPAGVGLLGLYSAIQELAQSIAGLGINSSAVRQIAYAAGSGDEHRIAKTAVAVRRATVVLGLTGAAALVIFCRPISRLTFDSEAFAGPIALLSLAVALRIVSDGQGAIILGLRRIGDLARFNVFAAVLGTAAGILFVFFLREQGLVPMLIGIAAASLLLSSHYRRKIALPRVSLSHSETRAEASALLTLGAAFMTSAVLMPGAAYLIRRFIAQASGLEAVGLYQAAWTVGGLYVGFILQAMATDFYPRLTAVADDSRACNRLVNEQAHVGLLLAGPGVLATLTAAPLVIAVLYSSRFAGAVGPLRWICLGMALRVVVWPMGYILLARSARTAFFGTELAATFVHVGLAYLLVPRYGVTGATMAFAGLYVWHGLIIYVIVRRFTGFRWSDDNRRTAAFYFALIAMVFSARWLLPEVAALSVGVIALLLSAAYSVLSLCQLVPSHRLPVRARQWVTRLQSAAFLAGRSGG